MWLYENRSDVMHMDQSRISSTTLFRTVLCRDHADWLQTASDRIERFPQRFDRPKQHYRETLPLVLFSYYSKVQRYAMCTTKVPVQTVRGVVLRESRCLDWQLCPYCCHLKRMQILRKYLPCFESGKFWFFNMSLERDVDAYCETEHCLDIYWSAMHYALKQACLEHLFEGAIVVEECLFKSYLPENRMLPHVHAVIRAQSFTMAAVNRIKQLFCEYNGTRWDSKKRGWAEPEFRCAIHIKPSTETSPLPDIADYASALAYLVKTRDLYTPYSKALAYIYGESKGDLVSLNMNKDHAFGLWEIGKYKRLQHYYTGCFHHSVRGFIGYGPRERNTANHKDRIRATLEEIKERRADGYDSRFNPESPNATLESQEMVQNSNPDGKCN